MLHILKALCVGLSLFAGARPTLCSAAGAQVDPQNSAELVALVPTLVLSLAQWPDDAALARHKVSVPPQKDALGRQQELVALQWIKKGFSATAAPSQDAEAFFIPTGEKTGVFRMRWHTQRHGVALSYAPSFIVVKLTPVDNQSLGDNAQSRLRAARELCIDLFRQEGTRQGADVETSIKVDGLAEWIAKASFSDQSVQLLQNGALFGQPRADFGQRKAADVKEWFESKEASRYWFRHVCWWNDGKEFVLYFPTIDGGSRSDESP